MNRHIDIHIKYGDNNQALRWSLTINMRTKNKKILLLYSEDESKPYAVYYPLDHISKKNCILPIHTRTFEKITNYISTNLFRSECGYGSYTSDTGSGGEVCRDLDHQHRHWKGQR